MSNNQDPRPTPDTGIGQGEAVKLAIEKLEEAWAVQTLIESFHSRKIKDLILEALHALKASSAPALKQEACGECGGDGIGRGLQGEKVADAGPCESCGGSGKAETK